MPLGNILDPIHDTLDPRVFDDADSDDPKLKQQHQDWIDDGVRQILEDAGYTHIDSWLSLVLTGSLTTYQYDSQHSDVDISLFVDTEVFPDWSRAEIIGLMVEHMDGKTLPGTTFPMQCFVVPPEIKKTDLYQPGLRSGWDFASRSWIVPPDPHRVHDVQREMNAAYVMGQEAADKMEKLLRYEPDKAIQYWHQIHKRRQRDQRAGKGDYSDSNIVYKFLANRGLFPAISEASGEYIAKVAEASGLVPYDGPRRFIVDKAAVRRAGRDLGLSKPVEVIQVGGTNGTVLDQPDRFLIGVVGWLRPDSASRQIWHEMHHAVQLDQGQTDILTTQDIPYEEYAAQPAEQDARAFADSQSEYPLTFDVHQAAAGRIVRKFVYDSVTDRLIVGEEGPEEGANLSHNQLCQQLGLGGLDELNGIAGTISTTGWVQFEYQHEQKGVNTAKTRYLAEQALKREVPDIQGFLGGETSDTLKQLWQFSSLPESTPEQAGT